LNSPHVESSAQEEPEPEVPYFPPPPGAEESTDAVIQPPEQSSNLEAPTVQGIDDTPKVENKDPNAPPPVPPPMTPQFYDADGNNSNPFKNPS
jgi:hypothetical protein